MISVNISELENMADSLVKASSASDETLIGFKKIASEIRADVSFMTYPQAENINEALSYSIEAFTRANDILQSLKGTILSASGGYVEKEREKINAVNRMTAYLGNVSIGIGSAVLASDVPISDNDGEFSGKDVEKLVSESVEELEIANIAAITRVVKEEYDPEEVKALETEDSDRG